MKNKAQPSMAVTMAKEKAKAFEAGQIPDDVGLMADTFVMPRGKALPGWFGNFRGRWKLERKRAWVRMWDVIGYVTTS